MTQTLSDFIVSRLRELAKLEEPLSLQLQAITKERNQLLKAAEASGIDVASEEGTLPSTINLQVQRRAIPEKTIKEAVIDVLMASSRAMTALEILDAINEKFSADYPRTSLSPQLSRLKADGKITRVGNLWNIRNRLAMLVEQPNFDEALK